MGRVLGIAIVSAVALASAGLNLRAAWCGGKTGAVRAAHARARGGPGVIDWPSDLPLPAGGGAPVCLCNDLPATVTVVSRPGEQHHRISWGGGDHALGVVSALVVVCHDPYWPYVYAVTCPNSHELQRIRVSDLQRGLVPEGFGLWRGRPEGVTGAVTWFDKLGGGERRGA